MCKLHNEVFGGAETRINTECFLPVWEGGSQAHFFQYFYWQFPPCVGGWIAKVLDMQHKVYVSSLYGRVDRRSGPWI